MPMLMMMTTTAANDDADADNRSCWANNLRAASAAVTATALAQALHLHIISAISRGQLGLQFRKAKCRWPSCDVHEGPRRECR